jgi:hypothetical protein
MKITKKWLALINWCDENKFVTFEKLEIHNGEPVIGTYKKTIYRNTEAKIKIKL